jgi:DNA polymerase-1
MPGLDVSMQSEELISIFNELIERYEISLRINESFPKIQEPIALDVEHDEAGTFVGCGLYVGSTNTCYYYSDLLLLNDIDFSTLSLICHNGRTDFDCLKSWGIDVKDTQLYWDTELSAHILDNARHGYGLKTLASSDLDIQYPSYDDIVGKRTAKQSKERKTLDKQPLELVAKYNCMDCYVTYKLYIYQSRISKNTDYFTQIERPVAFCLQAMENRGVCVDLQYLAELKKTLEMDKLPLETEIKNELGDINLQSPKQLLEALHAKEIYPTFKGKPSTDKRALSSITGERIIEHLKAYSEIDTLLTSFILPYLGRGQSIVHPWFNQCGTRTGRLSCSNPNLLQIPKKTENGKKVRRMFIPRPGMLMGDCDFGQIEPRVLAHFSKDPAMQKMFNDGIDFHTYTAERLGISRDRAKVLNLSVGYRATKYSVQRQLGGTHKEAQKQIDSWWNLFPTLRRWQDKTIYESKRSGFCTTLLGRRIKVENLNEGNPWKKEAAERQLINNITQGSAAEIMKMAMIKIANIAPQLGLLVQVYDSLLFESANIDQEKRIVISSMKQAMKLDVPLEVDYKQGKNWGDCE